MILFCMFYISAYRIEVVGRALTDKFIRLKACDLVEFCVFKS